MLWLALYLPALPLEVFARADPALEPLVVSTDDRTQKTTCRDARVRARAGQAVAPRVLIANRAARSLGVRPGMGLGAAHALAPGLRVRPRDAMAEQALIERLAAWAGQFTSQVSIAAPHLLLLEIEGSFTLFGGLAPLRERIRAQIAALGFETIMGVAPTPLAATWFARTGREAALSDPAELSGALAVLPLACLELTDRQRDTLHGMGVRNVGDCLRLPRAGLARRLGADLIANFDRALGRAPDPRPYYSAPARYRGTLALPGSVETTEGLLFALHRLLQELGGFLLARGAGVSALTLILHHIKRATTEVTLGLMAPSREVEHLYALWRERLARLELPAPVEEITLRAEALVPLASRAGDFFAPKHADPQTRAALIERLKARLGEDAVRGLALVAEHRPERAWCYATPGSPPGDAVSGIRPLWLLSSPLPLEVRDGAPWLEGALALAPDRERIESGWWDDGDVRRDYFVAHSPAGARLWVYRELSGDRGWFLHGVFG